MNIGYFKHWSQPPYKFVDFLHGEGIKAEEVNYTQKGYLEPFDVALIEQNGFNDYIENDELYIRDWVRRGGICLFMHQDYARWAPGFLPPELGYVQLIHRYVPTIANPGEADDPYMCYLMPWAEDAGKNLFAVPEKITPDELIDWRIRVNSFRLTPPKDAHATTETVRTSALSCYLANPAWETLGSYMDPAVRGGALILRGKYGKGMYFLNQILFPEEETPEAARCLAFWKKYVRNLLAYFARFTAGTPEPAAPVAPAALPVKKNYKMAIHVHSLDWYGCDSFPGAVNALMRYMNVDLCALAVKDLKQFNGVTPVNKYSDDHVLFLDGQEYHPFNWNDRYGRLGHNNYHMLAIGIDPDAYTAEFTRSLFSDAEADAYLKKAIRHVHAHRGAVCTAHPWCDYWRNYDYDAADIEHLRPLSGSAIEKYWLDGKRIALMNCVDLFGMRRMFDNPAVNFLYLRGETPGRDSVVRAIRAHHTIAGAWFDAGDVALNGHIPGDVVPRAAASPGKVAVAAKISEGVIRAVRIYAGARVIASAAPDTTAVALEFPLKNPLPEKFVRVEVEGDQPNHILASTPFFLV